MAEENLLGYLKQRIGGQQIAADAASFLEALKLPVPQKGQFFQTRDYGAQVFLTPLACSMRFTSLYHPWPEHRRLLQPLLRRELAGRMRVDIRPGVFTPFTGKDYTQWYDIYEQMRKELGEIGLDLNDINGNNGGQMPAPYGDFHVYIDDGAVIKLDPQSREKLRQETQTVGHAISAEKQKDPQREIFGTLKTLFQRAWPDGHNMPDYSLLKKAWEKCLQMRAEGALIANWVEVNYQGVYDQETHDIGEKYSEGLSASLAL